MTILLYGGYLVGSLLIAASVFLLLKRIRGSKTEINLSHFGTIKTTHPGLVLAFLGCVLVILSISSSAQRDELAQTVETLKRSQAVIVSFLDPTLLRDAAFLSYFRTAPQDQQEAILRRAIGLLRPSLRKVTDLKQSNFQIADFEDVASIYDFLSAVDANDGSALYYKGEVERLLLSRFKMRESFFLYLTHATRREAKGLDVLGYFPERAAWIHHLLANDYLCDSQQQPDLQTRLDLLQQVRNQLKAEAALWPHGFASGETTLSTASLSRLVTGSPDQARNPKCPRMS